jgi:hypothetical protein
MRLLVFFFFFIVTAATAQQFELTPNGFDAVELSRPARTNEKLIEMTKGWADFYHKQGHDVYNVTANSLDIDAFKDNAFFYHNLGELFTHRIKYTMRINFGEEVCRIQFIVKEIYAKKTLIKMTPSDFFAPDGTLKEDMDEAKTSLEKTANNTLNSFSKFILN